MPLTPEQAASREYRIGASEISAIFGDHPYCTPYMLWAKKTNRVLAQADEESMATELGSMIEPVLLDYYERKNNVTLERQVEFRAAGDSPVVATLDGYVRETGHVVEAKTACLVFGNYEMLSKWDDGDFPEHYRWQIQTQMFCAQSLEGTLLALVGCRGIRQYECSLDFGAMQEAVDVAVKWYDMHVAMDVEPPMQGNDLKNLGIIRPRTGEAVWLSREDMEAIDRAHDLSKQVKSLIDEIEEIKNQIRGRMALATEGLLPDGRIVTFRQQAVSSYVVQARNSRVLRLPKAKAEKGN